MGIILIGTRANPQLNQLIADKLCVPLAPCRLGQHYNGETKAIIDVSVRGQDVYIVSTGTAPINDNLMEAMFLAEACKFSNAKSVTLVLANYPYARSDKITQKRECIGSAYVVKMLECANIDRLITICLHCPQIQGMLCVRNICCDNIQTYNTFANSLRTMLTGSLTVNTTGTEGKLDPDKYIMVAPDEGAIKTNRKLADLLGLSLAMISKVRNPQTNIIDKMTLNETETSVKGKTAIIYDDIGDTLGTLFKCCQVLQQYGVVDVKACLTHGIFSNNAIDKLHDYPILSQIYVTNTVPLPCTQETDVDVNLNSDPHGDIIMKKQSGLSKIVVCDISELIVKNINCLQMGTSLSSSSLFI